MLVRKLFIYFIGCLSLVSTQVLAESGDDLLQENRRKPIFVILEVDERRPYMQAQVIVKVRLFRLATSFDAAMSLPHLSDPELSQHAFLKELKGHSRRYRTKLNSRIYVVTERYYTLFPKDSGALRLGPARFKGHLVQGGTIQFVEAESNIIMLRVKPIPESFTGSEWLPARSMTFFQDFHPSKEKLELGQAVSRTIYLTAAGLTSGHLPERIRKDAVGLKEYLTETERDEILSKETGLTAVLNQEMALIAVKLGALDIPEIEIPWWNTETDQQEILTIPGKRIESFKKAPIDTPEDTTPPEEIIQNVPNTALLTDVSQRQFWLVGVISFSVITLLFLNLLYRFKPKNRLFHLGTHHQQKRALADAVRACREHDAQKAESAIVVFSQTLHTDQKCQILLDSPLAKDPMIAAQLEELSTSRYGEQMVAWHGDELADLLRAWFVAYLESEKEGKRDQSRLDELYPLVNTKKYS